MATAVPVPIDDYLDPLQERRRRARRICQIQVKPPNRARREGNTSSSGCLLSPSVTDVIRADPQPQQYILASVIISAVFYVVYLAAFQVGTEHRVRG